MYWDALNKSCNFSCSNVHNLIQLNFSNGFTYKKQLNECLSSSSLTTYPNCEKIMYISESNIEELKCVSCFPDD